MTMTKNQARHAVAIVMCRTELAGTSTPEWAVAANRALFDGRAEFIGGYNEPFLARGEICGSVALAAPDGETWLHHGQIDDFHIQQKFGTISHLSHWHSSRAKALGFVLTREVGAQWVGRTFLSEAELLEFYGNRFAPQRLHLLEAAFIRAARVAGKNDFPACDPDTLILVDQEDVIRFNAFQRLLAARGGDDLDMIAGSPTHDYEAIDANARSHSSFVDPSFSALWRQLHSFKSVEQADAMISTEIHRLMTLRSDIYAYAGAGPGTRIDQAVLSAMGEGRAPEVAPVPPAPPTRANDDGPTP